MKRRARSRSLSRDTATTCAPRGAQPVFQPSSSGSSRRHGAHQLAQKFTTTTWPSHAASVVVAPSAVVSGRARSRAPRSSASAVRIAAPLSPAARNALAR